MVLRYRHLSQEADLINGGMGTSRGEPGCSVGLPVRGLAVELPDFAVPLLREIFNSQYFEPLRIITALRNYVLQNPPSDSAFGCWHFPETAVPGGGAP